jgi:signal transduction histidine kinase
MHNSVSTVQVLQNANPTDQQDTGQTQRLLQGFMFDITELKQTQDRAVRSERLAAIGQMVTGLAHESRNAFQRSQSCLEMLAMEVEDRPELLDLVNRIQRAQDHLHHLYEEVRDYAAPIKLKRQLCDIAQVWRDTWAFLEVMRDGKDLRLREQTSAISTCCRADPHAVEQLFRNILENAISACPEHGEVVIGCSETLIDSAPALRVSIRDNGPGIEPQSREKVFEPFFTTKTKGTGLGMAIARRIVEAHGGCIEVGDSEHGAEILIGLPRG